MSIPKRSRRSLSLARTVVVNMAHDELTIDLRTVDGTDILLFALRGSLDLATAPTVRAALADAADGGGHDCIVDLTGLEFLDSTGLGVLIGAHRRAAERGGSFRLVVSDGPILRLLNITGLVSVFSVYRSLQDAQSDRDRRSAVL